MKTTEERFWVKVDKSGPIHPVLGTRCWIWKGWKRSGYGYFWEGNTKKQPGAHVFSYKLAGGIIPDGFFICHKCDVRDCVKE